MDPAERGGQEGARPGYGRVYASARSSVALRPEVVAPFAPAPAPFLLLGRAPATWVARTGARPAWPEAAPGHAPDDGVALYLLHLTHPEEAAELPGLDQRGPGGEPMPSLLRDAAALALASGADGVRVALLAGDDTGGHEPGAGHVGVPWEVAPRTPMEAGCLERALLLHHGALVVVPDLTSPPRLLDAPATWAGTPLESECETVSTRWAAELTSLLPLLRAERQILVADLPPDGGGATLHNRLAGFVGQDLAVCVWRGEDDVRRRHGWRSASAAIGAVLAGRVGPGLRPRGLLGHSFALGPGRAGSAAAPPPVVGEGSPLVVIALEPDGRAVVLSEPTLRRPLGTWTLTAMWTARRVVEAVEEVAERFVFAVLSPEAPQDLRFAILEALAPYVREGVLASDATGQGPRVNSFGPTHRGDAVLGAVIDAVLLPWIVEVRVDVQIAAHQGVSARLAG